MKFLGIILIIASLILLQIWRKKEKSNNKLIIVFQIFLIAIFLEATIFNIKSYRMLFSDEEAKIYTQEEIADLVKIQDGTQMLTIPQIKSEVKTVYIKLYGLNTKQSVRYDIIYSDETTQGRFLPAKEYHENIENSKYTAVYLSGEVKDLTLKVYNTDSVQINEIKINSNIPFKFDYLRVLIIAIIFLVIYSYKVDDFWKVPYKEGYLKQELICLGILLFAVITVSFFNVYNVHIENDLYNTKFVEALENGQVHLLEEPSEKLLNLENPYDTSERSKLSRGIDYIWDAALYQNHYYIYYGILPALILFIPVHLMTGIFLQTATGVLIFSILCLMVLTYLTQFFYKKWFSKLPFKFWALAELIILFGTMIIWLNVAPRFYELAMVAGLYFALQGVYLVETGAEKNSIKRIGSGCLFLALAVACRPTQLITSILIIPTLLDVLLKNKKDFKKLICAVAIPYLIVGMLLMYYNYIRFDSIFEFGAKYQLTMNDMRNLKNRLITVPAGTLCNLFNMPIFKADFPFLESNGELLKTFAYYYIEDMPGGVFLLSPIAFFVFSIISFCKKTEKKDLKKSVIMLLLIGIILTLITTMQAGSTGRYLLDFGWMFVLAGILIFFETYELCKHEETKKVWEKIMIIIVIYTLLINICTGFLSVSGISMKRSSPEKFLETEYRVCFWE